MIIAQAPNKAYRNRWGKIFFLALWATTWCKQIQAATILAMGSTRTDFRHTKPLLTLSSIQYCKTRCSSSRQPSTRALFRIIRTLKKHSSRLTKTLSRTKPIQTSGKPFTKAVAFLAISNWTQTKILCSSFKWIHIWARCNSSKPGSCTIKTCSSRCRQTARAAAIKTRQALIKNLSLSPKIPHPTST